MWRVNEPKVEMTSLNLVAASHEDPGAEEELGEPPQLGTAP